MNLHDVIRYLIRQNPAPDPLQTRQLLLAVDAHEEANGRGPEVDPAGVTGSGPAEAEAGLTAAPSLTLAEPAPVPEEAAAVPAAAEPGAAEEPAGQPEAPADDTAAAANAEAPAAEGAHLAGADPTRTASGEERAKTEGDAEHGPEPDADADDAGTTTPDPAAERAARRAELQAQLDALDAEDAGPTA